MVREGRLGEAERAGETGHRLATVVRIEDEPDDAGTGGVGEQLDIVEGRVHGCQCTSVFAIRGSMHRSPSIIR